MAKVIVDSNNRLTSSVKGIFQEKTSTPEKSPDEIASNDFSASKKLLSVKVRVGGKLIPGDKTKPDFIVLPYRGMVEFLPRNESGFQSELQFRLSANLPITTGTLSAHESCGIAVHNARVEKMMQQHKDVSAIVAERDCSRLCGRTQPLGISKDGRSYWVFNSDKNSLFVCLSHSELSDVDVKEDQAGKQWYRFSDIAAIASIIAHLDNEEPTDELKRLFPMAGKLSERGMREQLVQKQEIPKLDCTISDNTYQDDISAVSSVKKDAIAQEAPSLNGDGKTAASVNNDRDSSSVEDMDMDEPFEEGEEVLIESISGKVLWDAKVLAVARDPDDKEVTGYRLHYSNWSSRFDEWVEPFRVVEPNENNLTVQEDLLEDILVAKEGLSTTLRQLFASNFLHEDSRARGPHCNIPEIGKVSAVNPSASAHDTTLALLKAALLTVELSLPLGSVDSSPVGAWNSEVAACWRSDVEESKDPPTLMGCLVLLEDVISDKWIRPVSSHLFSCMPRHWKAVAEASVSSLSLRIWLLDSGILYDKVDHKHRKSSNSKRRQTR